MLRPDLTFWWVDLIPLLSLKKCGSIKQWFFCNWVLIGRAVSLKDSAVCSFVYARSLGRGKDKRPLPEVTGKSSSLLKQRIDLPFTIHPHKATVHTKHPVPDGARLASSLPVKTSVCINVKTLVACRSSAIPLKFTPSAVLISHFILKNYKPLLWKWLLFLCPY